jgi:hypothetical protein
MLKRNSICQVKTRTTTHLSNCKPLAIRLQLWSGDAWVDSRVVPSKARLAVHVVEIEGGMLAFVLGMCSDN